MPLNSKQIRYLRAEAHRRGLKPIVMIGQKGLNKNVTSEIELALKHHELIKVKITGKDKSGKQDCIQKITDKTGCESVQQIGNIAVLFLEKDEDTKFTLPK